MPRVNLVPIEEQRKEIRRQYYIFPVVGAAVLMIAMGGYYFWLSHNISSAEQELTDLNASIARQAPAIKELQGYEAIQDEKQDRQSNVVGLYSQRLRWSRILEDLSYVIPEDIWLDQITGTVPWVVTQQEGGEEGENDFSVSGYAYDMDTVAVLIVRMGLIPSLMNVNLIYAEKAEVEDGGGVAIQFEVGADLMPMADIMQPAVTPSTGDGGTEETTTGENTSTTGTTGTGTSTTSTNGGRTNTTGSTTGE